MDVTKEIKIVIIFITLSSIMYSCSQSSHESKVDLVAKQQEEISSEGPGHLSAGFSQNPSANAKPQVHHIKDITSKLIKNADLEIEVGDYYKSRKQIDSITNIWDAFVMKESELHNQYKLSNTLILRVPNNQFENLIGAIGGMNGKLNKKNINVHDVTEEFVDLQTRIKTKKEVEKRFVNILQTADSVNEILAVENDIRKIREEIEAKEGRLRYLTSKVSYSTVTITIFQRIEEQMLQATKPGFFAKIGSGFMNGWEIVLVIIIGLSNIWPLILISCLAYLYASKKWKDKIKNNNSIK